MNKKISFLRIIFLILFFFPFCAYAHDDTLIYDFSSLGDLSAPWFPLPYNLLDFTIVQDSDVTIVYNGYDCNLDEDFYIYIDWLGFSIPCTGWSPNQERLEMNIINLSPWTYELYVDQNRDDAFEIRELYIYVDYTDWSLLTGTGVLYDSGYKTIWFFDSYEEFMDFAEQTTIMYLVFFFLIMIFFFWIYINNSI
jgi:hypothetical protein